MKLKLPLIVLASLGAFGATAQTAPADLLYTMEQSVSLPSTDTDWDYVKFEPGSSRLFMARLHDGLTVFDADTKRVVTTVANSKGANGPLLLPKFNRGYVAMSDGSLLSFDLKTLKVIARTKLASDGGLNSGIYDPASGRIHFITGTRPAEATWFSLDPATGKLLATTRFPFTKMDDPATDGRGNLYAPARHDNIILKLDARTLKEQARWTIGCKVSKVKWVESSKRIIGGCVGDNPMMFVLDPANGTVLSRVPIGGSIDALTIDDDRHRVIASSYYGWMTVASYTAPDELKLLGNVRTSYGARMMDMDHRTGKLFLVNADSTDLPAKSGSGEDTHYHPNSFRVEIWSPR